MATHSTKASEIKRDWRLISAKDEILGRLSSRIASLLQGKHKAYYSAHLDCGDYVVVTDAALVKVTGRKRTGKVYSRHSGYPQGFKQTTFEKLMTKDPTRIIYKAVYGMLPDNKLKSGRLLRLKIFPGSEHDFKDKKFIDGN